MLAMSKTVLEKIEEFKAKRPEIISMLLTGEIDEIHETGNAFDMIATAFFLGYMKGNEKKGGAV